MNPKPFLVNNDDSVSIQTGLGTPMKKRKIEDLSGKEFLFRLVALGQSIRAMIIFFVWVAILFIVGFTVIAGILLSNL